MLSIQFCPLGRLTVLALVLLFSAIPSLAHHPDVNSILFYGGGLPPYINIEADNSMSGFSVELLKAVMDEAEIEFDDSHMVMTNWARAVHDVEVSPGHALLCLARLPSRIERFKWVGPIGMIKLGVYARKADEIRLAGEKDIMKYELGMVRNTAPVALLKDRFPGIEVNMVYLTSIATQLRMLEAGRIDLIVQAEIATREYLLDMNMNLDDYEKVMSISPLTFYFGFNKTTDDAYIEQLQSALDRLKKEDKGISPFQTIQSKYFSVEEVGQEGRPNSPDGVSP